MARKPVLVRILGVPGKLIHDGIGGKHPTGSLVTLPVETAEAMIAFGAAQIADGTLPAAVAEGATEVARKAAKDRAKTLMKRHDRMPASTRALAAEHGDDVYRLWRDGLSDDEIIEFLTRPGPPKGEADEENT